jgi:glycosyltransferase involved in cell wall biosynthesis
MLDVCRGTSMRVGFGTTVLASGLAHGGVDGIGSYTRELGTQLSRLDGVTLVPTGFRVMVADNFFPGSNAPINLGRYASMAALNSVTPLTCLGEKSLMGQVDLFHATDHLIPKFSNIPVVATLMDAIPLSNPEWVRQRLAPVKRWLWRQAGHWADHVITISEYSKHEIVEHFGISPEKISVTPLGVDERFFDRIDAASRAEVVERLKLPERFFLFVGTLQPRKNLERALEAHAKLPAAMRADVPLVVVGRAGWGCEGLVARLTDRNLGGMVRWLQYLPDYEVRCLMQTATALIFPSLCEGFGLPVVEAFASGLPVVTSNTTSLPEVAGEAALLVNPEDAGEISDALHQVIEVSGLAERLTAAGLQRARQLSWKACAQGTLDVYQRVTTG